MVLTDPGSVPPNWSPVVDEEKADTIPLTVPDLGSPILSSQSVSPPDTSNPRVRYCRKCNNLKPPRCHHCSVCECIYYDFVA